MEAQRLSRRQARFVAAYLNSEDPAEAARAAGYAPARAERTGLGLLEQPAVRQAVEEARSRQSWASRITRESILRELAAIAFSDFTDYIRVEDGTVVITDSRDLDRSHRSAIAGIKDTGKGVEIKLHDKQKALELLAKYLGLFDQEEAGDPCLRVVLDPEAAAWSE